MRIRTLFASTSGLLLLATTAGAQFPATAPDDPRFAPDTCPPAASCAGVSGQWNLLSYASSGSATTRSS